jgi:hypothetical protein
MDKLQQVERVVMQHYRNAQDAYNREHGKLNDMFRFPLSYDAEDIKEQEEYVLIMAERQDAVYSVLESITDVIHHGGN